MVAKLRLWLYDLWWEWLFELHACSGVALSMESLLKGHLCPSFTILSSLHPSQLPTPPTSFVDPWSRLILPRFRWPVLSDCIQKTWESGSKQAVFSLQGLPLSFGLVDSLENLLETRYVQIWWLGRIDWGEMNGALETTNGFNKNS